MPCHLSFPWMNEEQPDYGANGLVIIDEDVDLEREYLFHLGSLLNVGSRMGRLTQRSNTQFPQARAMTEPRFRSPHGDRDISISHHEDTVGVDLVFVCICGEPVKLSENGPHRLPHRPLNAEISRPIEWRLFKK